MIDDFPFSSRTVADRWLRVFLAVVGTGLFSASAAARWLGVAQPAVSHDTVHSLASTGPHFSDYSLVARAAIAGQGVALAWHHIVNQLVEEGGAGRYRGGRHRSPFRPARPARRGAPARCHGLLDWIAVAHGSNEPRT